MKKIADTIENATNGKPLQNATVSLTIGGVAQALYLTNEVGTAVYSVLTDADGYYEFYAPDGVYSFVAAYGDTSKTVEDFEVYDESEQRAILAALPVLAYGTYTPTVSNGTNLDSVTPEECTYLRVGSSIWVFGVLVADPTSVGPLSTFELELPVASNFASTGNCGGTISAVAIEQGGGIYANTTNDTAEFSFKAASASAATMTFQFGYRVI